MFNESPSTFGKILVTLRNILQNSEPFEDIDVYFDDSEMNPNVPLPAISFKVGKKELTKANPICSEYVRHITIRLHTKTVDKRELQEELYKFEEDIIKVINNARITSDIDFFEIVETGSTSINALMFNARKEGNQTDMTFFSNLLGIKFDIRYEI